MVIKKEEVPLRVKPDLKGKGDFSKTDKTKRLKEKISSEEETEDESSSSSNTGTSESESDSDDTSSAKSSSSAESSSTTGSDEKVVDKKTIIKQGGEPATVKKKSVGRNIRDKFGSNNSSNSANNQSKIRPKRKRRKPRPLTICLTNCRYEIVRNVAKQYSLLEVGEDEAWNIYWTDFSVSLERAMDMRRYQLVNHFPGMNEICRKDLLSRNLNRMKRLFHNDYDVFPKTWSLPADLGELQNYAHTRKNKTYICKPEMGCQGRGIFLIRSIKDLNPFGKIICQLYISRPFLIDNFKFDLRIYVLLTTCDPLRIYVYKEGLARFATAKYKPPTNSNTENSYMHLTNYAVNKYSRDYVVDDEGGSKRKLSSVYRWLEQRGYDTEELMNNIDDVIIKTIISAHPILKHNYRTCYPHHDICSACFEILGFDILVDYKLKPYVLEVNHSPSFHTDEKLDKEIKEALLYDTFAMLNMKQLDRYKIECDDRKRVQERLLQKQNNNNNDSKKREGDNGEGLSIADLQFQWELDHCGGYRLIYPSPASEKYDKFFEQNLSSLYHETTASQARANCTRTQMEEYNKMKQQEERKRIALGQAGMSTERPKEKVRPESPADPEKIKKKSSRRQLVLKKKEVGCFVPCPILADEELDRMKSLMERGMIIRSLGIEIQVFKLLCQIGNLKPEEEKLFRRMHGFHATNSGGGGGGGGNVGGPPASKIMINKDNSSRIPDNPMEHMQRGDAANVSSHHSSPKNHHHHHQQSQPQQPQYEATNKGDFKYPITSATAESPRSYEPSSYSPRKFEHGKIVGIQAPATKNPYNVPYNSPAQFGNNHQIHHHHLRSTSSPNQTQAHVSVVSNISNFMDKVNPSISNVMIDDHHGGSGSVVTPSHKTAGYQSQLTERRFYPRYTTAAAVAAQDSNNYNNNNNSNHTFISTPSTRYQSMTVQQQQHPEGKILYTTDGGTIGGGGGPKTERFAASNKNYQNLRPPPKTAGMSSSSYSTNNDVTESRERPAQNIRIQWPPPPLVSQNHQQQSGQYGTNDPNRLRTLLANSTTKSFRPQVTQNWPPRYSLNSSRLQLSSNALNGSMYVKRIGPTQQQQQEDSSEPVQCTQMFFNDKGFPTSQQSGTRGAANNDNNNNSKEGRMTNLNFLRGVGNVALLRAGRLNVIGNGGGQDGNPLR